MKYLYPYECFKRKLSSPSELQSAIDGNRRDSRRTYGAFGSPGGPVDGGYGRVSPPSVSMGYSSNHSPVLRPSPGPSPTGDEVCGTVILLVLVRGIIRINRVRRVAGLQNLRKGLSNINHNYHGGSSKTNRLYLCGI